jgi:hypothetical protein
MKTLHIESIGDESSAIYIQKFRLWYLVCIINPEDAQRFGNSWPHIATQKEVTRWKASCRTHQVEWTMEAPDFSR